jgi:2-polyprenyl-6-methoxyphenol hydroxylase-like FAD-dependent oxidoreductase
MMLGFLLARAGVDVIVLERHEDFFRDFRGDTIHPSTLELLHELGILEDFLKLPHQELSQLQVQFEDVTIGGPDFSHLPTRCKFIAFMPQWDFLNFLAEKARSYPSFQLRMNAGVTDLIEEDGRITGVVTTTEAGQVQIRADIVFGADGRSSVVRDRAMLEVQEFGVPLDVLWFRLNKLKEDTSHFLGRIKNGRMLLTIDRGDYYQCGSVIPKGKFEEIKQHGLEAFQQSIVSTVPFLADSVKGLDSWNKVKLLTVQVNRLSQWFRPGLLCIGDAAHAMSPAGGVGINLAVQDAVAAANLLSSKLLRNVCTTSDLARVQQRREWPVRVIQTIQLFIHRRMFASSSSQVFSMSWPARKILLLFAPLLRRLAGRLFGMGIRTEHILNK